MLAGGECTMSSARMRRAPIRPNVQECPGAQSAWASNVTRRENAVLSDPYEQERARLSRELHDGIAQRIALVAGELAMLRRQLTDASAEIQQHVVSIASAVASIGSDLHRMTRGLHPAGLERLGLVASMRRYCEALANVHRITIDAELDEVPIALDTNVALCVYRIAQEALHNVVRHSGACHATVALRTVRGQLVLRVVDSGVGFEPETAHRKDTLGLLSMRERAALAQAQLFISSTPGRGTAVEVRVAVRQPFSSISS
jgi:signal transduction histidine kinase